MLNAKVARIIKTEPNQSIGFIITPKKRTEPSVAVMGSKASIKLKVVALIYFSELVANWNGISVPIMITAATDHQIRGSAGKAGCAGWMMVKAMPEIRIDQPVKVNDE